ncbi:hypothetical protein SAMN05216339_102327 [Nitrosomonas eutropha]|uniref:HNH nuclease domain-containing protein n=1 Tax=Nitrosomonas eutropha TaxID=916 RepID=A0A1I7GAV6_9PROT|nr:hypothetical protein [Nitrosomonas eutropha]SFU45376.1 hypothetical protein SAMN05216339_102327 [Nitrosomonas eutropha]
MKLPDFFEFKPLNFVKAKMGIPQDVYGDLTVSIDPARLTRQELEKLTSQDGLDISLDKLAILSDGTLAYKDSRVILYIRDVSVMGEREIQPKFHLANCRTLLQMRENNRFERYVVSIRTDGHFNLNIIQGKNISSGLYKLDVCQNCLNFLTFNGFMMSWPRQKRSEVVREFKIDDFFEQYPKSLHSRLPGNTSNNAPLNIYPENFAKISQKLRGDLGWICQSCRSDFSAPSKRKWLHVHHINGLKHDNNKSNLAVLCISCHAQQPNHEHMINNTGYRKFVARSL